jgi:hypothetical protein
MSFFFGGPSSHHTSVTRVTQSPNTVAPKSFQNLVMQAEQTFKFRERLRDSRPKVQSFNFDIKPSMSRPRYKPSYERRKEIERMNEQLYDKMIKI